MLREVAGDKFQPGDLPRGRVAVLFCADWCGYCTRFLPLFKQLPAGVMVDVSDEDLPAWDDYSIAVVPTVLLFVDGEPQERRWEGVLKAKHMDEIVAALR